MLKRFRALLIAILAGIPLATASAAPAPSPAAAPAAPSPAALAPPVSFPAGPADPTAATVKDFVGTWKLVAYRTRERGGEWQDIPEVGRITYDAAGNMAAQLMRTDGGPVIETGARRGSAAADGATSPAATRRGGRTRSGAPAPSPRGARAPQGARGARANAAVADPAEPTDYLAYYGTIRLEADRSRVVHIVEGSTLDSWIGSNQVRYYTFKGKQLILSSQPDTENRTLILVWERIG